MRKGRENPYLCGTKRPKGWFLIFYSLAPVVVKQWGLFAPVEAPPGRGTEEGEEALHVVLVSFWGSFRGLKMPCTLSCLNSSCQTIPFGVRVSNISNISNKTNKTNNDYILLLMLLELQIFYYICSNE